MVVHLTSPSSGFGEAVGQHKLRAAQVIDLPQRPALITVTDCFFLQQEEEEVTRRVVYLVYTFLRPLVSRISQIPPLY